MDASGDVLGVEHAEMLDQPEGQSNESVDEGRVVLVHQGVEWEEDTCGVCLENPGEDRLVVLWCCRNTLCLKDAQLIGACPFCREEPLVWSFKKN
jgi:hypothetical protein